jgi:hypothetical protein
MLFAMVYYFAGYRLVYFLITSEAKYTASAIIKSKSTKLENLQLNTTEFSKLTWTEENKEFVYNGQLYDIVGLTKINNTYSIKAYCDKNETQWVKALHNFVKQLFPANGKNNRNVESILTAFQKEYLPLQKTPGITPDVICIKQYSQTQIIKSVCPDKGIWHPPSCC